MSKQRLDLLLVEHQLAPSREQAQRLIRAGKVLVDETVIDKPGSQIDTDTSIRVQTPKSKFASRGGEKLQAALETFPIDVQGKSAADLGASNGGFTDCLLRHGAAIVFAIDVGQGQLAYPLQIDERVVVMDKTNCRYLTREHLGQTVDLVVADLSFISIRTVFPAIMNIIDTKGDIVVLLKPQFEIGKGRVGKGGLVRDPKDHIDVLNELYDFFASQHWPITGLIPSPIRGKSGNIEFAAWLRAKSECIAIDRTEIKNTVNQAHHK